MIRFMNEDPNPHGYRFICREGIIMNRAQMIRRGNILITDWHGERDTGCYLGNGRFGAVMASTGLNLSPAQQEDPLRNVSHFRHISHWGRFRMISRYTQKEASEDYLLPLFRLYWENDFQKMDQYRQCHDLYDGVLNTCFRPKDGERFSVTSWFDAVNKNQTGTVIDVGGDSIPDQRISLSVLTPFNPWRFMCQQDYEQGVSIQKESCGWRVTVSCADAVSQVKTDIFIATNMNAEPHSTGLRFELSSGTNWLLISIGEPPSGTAGESLEQTKMQNHITWEKIGLLEYSQDEIQKVLLRSVAYLLSSYDADSEYIQPANCMGINGFPFNFVPDIANIAPAMMMLGRWDIVRRWVEKLAGEIEAMQQYARFLWPEAEGVFPPWQLNYGPMEGYHAPNAPMIFFYEAHNTGYLCKLAMEALEHSSDERWNKEYAYPLIRECARFFSAFCRKGPDGLWHLKWYPCMGRDEAGGQNKEDYLCTLIAAKYTFQAAVRLGLDQDGKYGKILEDGLAFRTLRSERGILHTCVGCDDFGKQKHPIQLEGVACFQTESYALEEEKAAHRMRYDITSGARIPSFSGWTLALLLMVDTNLKDRGGWSDDWDLLRPSDNADDMWIQFYESSGVHKYAFYTATHGMILQSLIRNCVNDYWNRLEIGSCIPADSKVTFENICTRFGVRVSGRIENGRATGIIAADRASVFEFRGDQVKMEPGETIAYDYLI